MERLSSWLSGMSPLSEPQLFEDTRTDDPVDIMILIPFVAAYACLFGSSSLPVILVLLMVMAVTTSQFMLERQYRLVVDNLVTALVVWLNFVSVEEHMVLSTKVAALSMVMCLSLHLRVRFRRLAVLATVTVLSPVIAHSLDHRSGETLPSQPVIIAAIYTFFTYESEGVIRKWFSLSQSNGRPAGDHSAARPNTLNKDDNDRPEANGAVTSAINRLFAKAFGNYDLFSREVAKLVKEVKANLPKESLALLNEKEVDFSAFELERKLASGGFCTVFRGKWKQGNRQCAVKSFSSADRLDSAGLRGLVNEVVVLTTLNHNNIIKVLGYCWSPQVCLVMEYMAKGTLHDMLAYKSLSISWEAPLLSIAIQIADAIGYLHSRNPPIIHRDIKTRNILMKDFRTCKLADFGLMVEEGSDQARAGTLRYVAPEVVNRADTSQQNTTRADIWSYGVCLWEMATRAQFSGLPPSYTLFSPASRTLFVSKLPYKILTGIYDVIEACLQPDPEKRVISAKVAEKQLRACLLKLEDETAWFNDEDLPKVPYSAGNGGMMTDLSPEDLSMDASMSWRAGSMWRRSSALASQGHMISGGGEHAAPDGSSFQQTSSMSHQLMMNAELDTSKTLDDLGPNQRSDIKFRLGRAEARNSRQLQFRMNDSNSGDLPVLPTALPSMQVHERLSILSRLAEADKSSIVDLERKVSSQRLDGRGSSCRLLEIDFTNGGPGSEDSSLRDGEENDASASIVRPPDASTRLGLLSRLALAENRTQSEAQTKFTSSQSSGSGGNFGSHSRLLDTVMNDPFQASSSPIVEAGVGPEVQFHHRLGLLARLADAEVEATSALIDKVSSSRTVDDSCPLLKVEYSPSQNSEEIDLAVEAAGAAAQGGSQQSFASSSSLNTRLLARLGMGESSNDTLGGVESAGGGNEFSSPASARQLAKQYGTTTPMMNATPTPTPAALGLEIPTPNVESTNRFISRLTGDSASLNEASNEVLLSSPSKEFPQAENNVRTLESLPAPVSTVLNRLAIAEAVVHGDLESRIGKGSIVDFAASHAGVPTDGDAEAVRQTQPISASPPVSAVPDSDFQDTIMLIKRPLDLLSRLANAEASAVTELHSRVESGQVNVSCSLLAFPVDEDGEDEEVFADDEMTEEDGTSLAVATSTGGEPSDDVAVDSPLITEMDDTVLSAASPDVFNSQMEPRNGQSIQLNSESVPPVLASVEEDTHDNDGRVDKVPSEPLDEDPKGPNGLPGPISPFPMSRNWRAGSLQISPLTQTPITVSRTIRAMSHQSPLERLVLTSNHTTLGSPDSARRLRTQLFVALAAGGLETVDERAEDSNS